MTTAQLERTEVVARRVPPGPRHRTHWLLVVDRCPFCRRKHTHGGGPDGLDAGLRVPHCTGDKGTSYFLLIGGAE